MIWNDRTECAAIDDYALYMWGSYAAAVGLVVIEVFCCRSGSMPFLIIWGAATAARRTARIHQAPANPISVLTSEI